MSEALGKMMTDLDEYMKCEGAQGTSRRNFVCPNCSLNRFFQRLEKAQFR